MDHLKKNLMSISPVCPTGAIKQFFVSVKGDEIFRMPINQDFARLGIIIITPSIGLSYNPIIRMFT